MPNAGRPAGSKGRKQLRERVALRKALESEFSFLKFPDFPTAKPRQPDRVERLDEFLLSLMDHPDIKRSPTFCSFINIAVELDEAVLISTSSLYLMSVAVNLD